MDARLARWLTGSLAAAGAPQNVTVFFRADDIGVPGRSFQRLIQIFQQHGTPLGLAVVPTWLTPARWERLQTLTRDGTGLWCWHQHGWRHCNHEAAGKKQEFGPARPPERVSTDLRRGRERLEELMGPAFYPAFTPPWNRCSAEALTMLQQSGYHAVSRSAGSLPAAPSGLPDLAVNVDLHTRKEPGADLGWQGLQADLQAAIATGRCGIMLHHQRMNETAAAFLDALLAALRAHGAFDLKGMPELADGTDQPTGGKKR
jgi:hypothetical protein